MNSINLYVHSSPKQTKKKDGIDHQKKKLLSEKELMLC